MNQAVKVQKWKAFFFLILIFFVFLFFLFFVFFIFIFFNFFFVFIFFLFDFFSVTATKRWVIGTRGYDHCRLRKQLMLSWPLMNLFSNEAGKRASKQNEKVDHLTKSLPRSHMVDRPDLNTHTVTILRIQPNVCTMGYWHPGYA